nr:hydrogenase formation protein HypD [Vibrio aerogenes]
MNKSKKLYQDFRAPRAVKTLAEEIKRQAEKLTQPLYMMEVCGGHTHTIMKYGLKSLLPEHLNFIHGPGCPVCIMPKERIDHATTLAMHEGVIVVTLGDMIRVPGSRESLGQCRARGGSVEAIYDPMDALTIARENPDMQVVYFAIGFETTTPMTAVLVQLAEKQQINNLYFHINHVLVPPAMHAVMNTEQSLVNAFIGPSHVSVITGSSIYQPIVDQYNTPVVVSGFEPADVLESVLMLVRQVADGRSELENQYTRAVSSYGNLAAKRLTDDVFEVRESFNWRGLGTIPDSALRLGADFSGRDAEVIFGPVLPTKEIPDHKVCRCGDILRGLAGPEDCKVFGKACRPDRPMGSCMVSSEGACNAYYRYGGLEEINIYE